MSSRCEDARGPTRSLRPLSERGGPLGRGASPPARPPRDPDWQVKQILGFDLNGYFIDICSRRGKELGYDHVKFAVGDALRLPVEPGTADLVTAVESCAHFDRATFARGAHRALKPGGRLAICDFFSKDAHTSKNTVALMKKMR